MAQRELVNGNRMRSRYTLKLLLLCGLILFKPSSAVRAQEAEFESTTYLSGLNQPTALAFDPEGRLFIAEKAGTVRIAMRGMLREKPVIELRPHTFFECGLVGIALDPDYSRSPFMYVFATISPDEQQIVRYRIANGVGVEPHVVRAHLPTSGSIHNGGCLRFGPDGMLYFSIGDNGIADLAQDATSLAGKVCRITREGATPQDNPYTTATGAPSAIYATGFRNPFRFCFDEQGRLFVTDVGSFGTPRREEINLVRPGRNYGWPAREGGTLDGDGGGYTAPILDYADEGTCVAGIVAYSGDHFPENYRGNLFHLDYTLSRIFRVVLNGDRVVSHTLFVQAEGNTVDLVQGPDGRLYYSELATGTISRIGFPSRATTEPAAGVADDDWGGAPEVEDIGQDCERADASIYSAGCSDENTDGGIASGGLLGGLCGAGAALLFSLGLFSLFVRHCRDASRIARASES